MLEGWPPPVFDPAGPHAGSISILSWVLLGMAALVLLVVFAALWFSLFGRRELRAKIGTTKVIWIGGIAFPVVVLTLLLFYGLSLTRDLTAPIRGDEMRVRIIGEQWWWRVVYLDEKQQPLIHDANELHIPAGQPVALELEAADVIHSFWVPRLSGKLDMIPGRRNLMVIQADNPGVYGGQCAEYCGGPHALMGFLVVAHPPEDFSRLMQQRLARVNVEQPRPAEGGAGAQLFQSAGCAACHRIAGTQANGLAGPDLTHVGTRRTLGAGVLPNNHGTMMRWIGNSHEIKPSIRMPPYEELSGDELAALAIYLESQR